MVDKYLLQLHRILAVIKPTVTIMKELDHSLTQEEYFQTIEDLMQLGHRLQRQQLITAKMDLRCRLKDHHPIAKEEINKELLLFLD